MSNTIAIVVGTRPEAVKVASVYRALRAGGLLTPVLISTGQHRELLESALTPLELQADHQLDVMSPGQSLNQITARVIERLSPVLSQRRCSCRATRRPCWRRRWRPIT